MIKLISCNTHENGINVFFDQRKNIYYKTTSTFEGVNALIREKSGWEWYSKNILKQDNIVWQQMLSTSYCRINIRTFPGIKVNYGKTFLENIDYVHKFVEWYIKNWPKKDVTPIHGDLTFDNILFYDDNIYLIDWENFLYIDVFWGYDALYFLLSSLFLPKEKFFIPDKNSLKEAGEVLFKLKEAGMPENILETPLLNVRKIISEKLLKANHTFPTSKLFPLKFSDLETDIIDESLVRSYRYSVYEKYIEGVSS